MAEKCTNTSSPLVRWINPYPFAPLNHFTVPFSRSLTVNSFRSVVACHGLSCPAGRLPGGKYDREGKAHEKTEPRLYQKKKCPRVRRGTLQRQAPGPSSSPAGT